MSTTEKYDQIIKEYIEYCNSGKWEEKYKWETIAHFQNVWDIDAEDFGAMFEEALKKRSNLLNRFPVRTLIEGAKLYSNELKAILKYIFDEEKGLINVSWSLSLKRKKYLTN